MLSLLSWLSSSHELSHCVTAYPKNLRILAERGKSKYTQEKSKRVKLTMRTFALLRHNLPSYSASVKTSLSFVERPLTSCLRTTFSRARTGLFTRNFHPPFRIRIQSPSCKSFTSLCDWATRSLTWSYTATHRSNQRNVPWWHFLGFYKAASLITN